MDPFATAADLGVRLGIDLTAEEQTRATALLAMASGLIRSETRQTISLVTDDELLRRGVPSPLLRLPQRPVVSVTSVQIDGEAVAPDSYYLAGDELVRSQGWGHPHNELAITYTHGFDSIPEEVRIVALEAVVRVWVNPGVVRQEQYGSEQVMHFERNGLILTPAEREVLRSTIGRGGAYTVRLR